jgi:2,4-dienoyl-CoA reductase-like NADH-dependent reductase (Old Yellow Enzyme family)
MATRKATSKGEVTEELVKHYVERASGGPGLVIVEHSYVSREGRASERQLGIYDNKLLPGLTQLSQAIHRKGAAAAIQISHAGSSTTTEIANSLPIAPSPIRNPKNKAFDVPRAMSVREIRTVIDAFAKASGRAVEAGFDAVEIHGAHGYLIGQFLSPLTNLRLDEFGGVLENRARFAIQVIEQVRQEVGRDFPILYRLGCDDMLPGGLTLDEGKRIARMVIDAGVDILDVSGGLGGSIPPGTTTPGFFVSQAEAIRKAVNNPVIAIGGITTPEVADNIVRERNVDLVAVGRSLFENPLWGAEAVRALQKQAKTTRDVTSEQHLY